MSYIRSSGHAGVTLASTDNLYINTLEVDFPESTQLKGRIFGNGYHNIPVRIRFKILDRANNNKDVSAQYKDAIHLYDVSANCGIADGVTLNGTISADLFADRVASEYTLGLYAAPSVLSASQDTGGMTEVMRYVRTRQPLTTMKDFKIGAYLALHDEATPGGNMVSANDKFVTLTVLPPINYADPGQWAVGEGITTGLTPEGGMNLNGVDPSQVTLRSRQFSLQHSMLKDNSPIRLTVNSAYTHVGNPMHLSGNRLLAGAVLTDNDALGKQEARGMCWLVPEGGVTYTMQPVLISSAAADNGIFMEAGLSSPVTLFGADSNVNKNAAALTLVQGEMLIRNEKFTVPGGQTRNTGVLSLSDNVGHMQSVQVVCDTSTGRPLITGKG